MYNTTGSLESETRNIGNVEHVGHPMWQIVACRLLCPHVYNIKKYEQCTHYSSFCCHRNYRCLNSRWFSSDETGQIHTV